jgi:hypothetical protein
MKISVKAKKDLAKQVLSRLARLQPKEIVKHQLELSGIKGTTEGLHKERQSLTWMMCGSYAPLENQVEYEGEYQAWLDSTPDLITEDQIKHEVKRADELFYRFVRKEDRRTTPQEHTEQQAIQEKQRQEREEKQAIEAKARSEREMVERAELRKQYHYLVESGTVTTAKGRKLEGRALASKNIKTELAHTFPRQTFSVTSESFSMGNAVRISWDNGPTAEEVDEVTDKYEYGTFDAMTDMSGYKQTGNVFRGLYGDAKYVSTSRTITDDTYQAVAAEFGKVFDPSWNAVNHEDMEMIRREAHERSYYVAPVTQEAPTIADSGTAQPMSSGPVHVSRNEEKQGIEIKFDNKPGPDTLESLKTYGFMWSRFQSLWWARFTDQRWAFALSLQSDEVDDDE